MCSPVILTFPPVGTMPTLFALLLPGRHKIAPMHKAAILGTGYWVLRFLLLCLVMMSWCFTFTDVLLAWFTGAHLHSFF